MSNQFEEFFNNIPKNQPYSDNQIINNFNNNQNSGNYEFKKFSHNNFDINNNINLNKNNINNNIDEEMKAQNEPYGSSYDEGSCSSCKSIFEIKPLECCHMMCGNCINIMAEKDLYNVECKQKGCSEKVTPGYLKILIGDSKYNHLEEKAFGEVIGAYGKQIICANQECRELIFFEKGKIDFNIKDDKNKIISKESAECYAENRCKCPRCNTEFCISCNFAPFHLGKTCEEQKRFKAAVKCKFCLTEINPSNQGPALNVCRQEDCLSSFKIACPKVLLCGHQCYGTVHDKVCPPCLNKNCDHYVNYFDQNEDDYCNICFAEGLGNAPVILLKCNHYLHFKCLELSLKKKYIGPKITFNHCYCPICKNWLDCPTNPTIQSQIVENKQLYDLIVKMSLERLKFEGLEKDNLLVDPNSLYYNKPLDFALKKLSYYMCYECKKPYFAGLRDCRGGPGEDNNPNREYDPKDLICGAHANIAGVAGITDCPKHGKDFIEFKCKFCCNIASWYCWGSTHFCEDCHARQCKGDYVSKYTKDKLPKCLGATKCSIKVKHPENGDEFALGCSVCRNASENYKNF